MLVRCRALAAAKVDTALINDMLLLKFREKKTVVGHHKPSPATLPLRLSDARVVAHSSQYSSHLGTIQSLTWEHAIETVPRSCQLAHKRIAAPGQGVVPLRLQQPTAPPGATLPQ